jgi:hypothetical protein
MPQSVFRQRLEALQRESYSVLPFEEAVERLYAGDLPPRAVTLTFDDGFHDFRERACPVLKEFGFPATVYLTTYYSVNQYPVFNIFFAYLLWKARHSTVDLSGIVPETGPQNLGSKPERDAVHAALLSRVTREKLTNGQQSDIARNVAEQAGLDYDRLCKMRILHIMPPDEVAELPQFGVTVQLHTHRHRTPNDEELFRREIRDNREQIARMGLRGPQLQHFCYPSGVYQPSFFGWLEAENVRTATTCKSGLTSRSTARLEMPRLIDTCNITSLEFEGWLTGASHLLPRRT